jgi:hypothetical protein
MIVYKVFYKNYELKKGELIGALIERRNDLRGATPLDSGLKWAKLTFGSKVPDKQLIYVVPNALKVGNDEGWLKEKAVFSKDEFLEMEKSLNSSLNHQPE